MLIGEKYHSCCVVMCFDTLLCVARSSAQDGEAEDQVHHGAASRDARGQKAPLRRVAALPQAVPPRRLRRRRRGARTLSFF